MYFPLVFDCPAYRDLKCFFRRSISDYLYCDPFVRIDIVKLYAYFSFRYIRQYNIISPIYYAANSIVEYLSAHDFDD